MKNKKIILLSLLVFLSAGCNFFSKSLPNGVIKTVNSGQDWQFSNAVKDKPSATMGVLNISKLAFDPKNRQTIFAGAYNGGLYKSEDSAATWTNIFPNKIFVYDFFVDPNDSKIIYAAGFYDGSGRVAKTTDGGASWSEVYHEAAVNNAVRSIAYNPNNSNQILIGTAWGTVMKSFDGGNTWQLVKDFKVQVNRVTWEKKNMYVLLKTDGLKASPDQGTTFNDATAKIGAGYNIVGFSYEPNAIGTFSQVYVDSLDENLIYLTTDKGLYKTTDGGAVWKKINLPVKTEGTAARAIAVSKNNSNTVYASINATIYKSTDGANTWQTQGIKDAGGFVNAILIDPELPQIVYGGIYGVEQ